MRRGQSAMEYMILLSLLLVVILPLAYYSSISARQQIRSDQAQDAVEILARTADRVGVFAEGTSTEVWITLPFGVESFQAFGSALVLELSTSGNATSFESITKNNVQGILPTEKGRHLVRVSVLENGSVSFE